MRQPLQITVVYNNVPHTSGLATAWGFAALIRTGKDAVLFDTGGEGPTLLSNLRRLRIDPASIDAIVLSHIHGDHTGGLDRVLDQRSSVTVCMPVSFPAAFRRKVEKHGARVETVSGPRRLLANLYTTGELGESIKEQALIVEKTQDQNLGVHKVAPSHCTGAPTVALFRESWASGFIEGGCGAIVEIL